MPYILRKIKNGYKVCKKDETKKCFSKKPLTKETAMKQMYAIQANENMEGSGTHKTNILKKYDLEDKGYSLEELSKITGEPISTLQEVYNRGIGAYKTNPTSVRMKGSYKKNVKAPMSKKLSKEQWAMARVYSFLDGNPKHDNDLREDSDDLEGGLKPLTARVGGKVLLKKQLINNYFPEVSSYKTYVEPFVGAGAVYFYKNKDNKKEVINDIDPKIYQILKGFQKYDARHLREDLNGDYTQDDFNKIKESKPTTEYKKFLKTYLLYRLSYFGLGETYGKPRINSKFEGYTDRLNDTTILNVDFRKVIEKYNNKDTFFYLDPPVANSNFEYKYDAIDVYDIIPILKSIKGLFCLTYANTSIKKELFKGFKVFTVNTKYVGEKSKGGQSKKVKEYIITNYDPIKKTMTGGCATCGMGGAKPANHCSGCMGKCGKGMVKFHKQLEKVGLTHDKYMKQVKILAKDTGYDPSKVHMSEDEDHKCVYHSPDGDVYFGKVGYGDFIIYSWLEQQGEEEEGFAEMKRNAYVSRASNIKGDWKDNKYSPNNLAINLLWAGNI